MSVYQTWVAANAGTSIDRLVRADSDFSAFLHYAGIPYVDMYYGEGIVRNRLVLIPGSGMQLTNISHVRGLSSMLLQAVGNPTAAAGKIFNYVSDCAVTLDGFARLCARAACKEVKIIHYDPKALGVEVKKAFPFVQCISMPSRELRRRYWVGQAVTNFVAVID